MLKPMLTSLTSTMPYSYYRSMQLARETQSLSTCSSTFHNKQGRNHFIFIMEPNLENLNCTKNTFQHLKFEIHIFWNVTKNKWGVYLMIKMAPFSWKTMCSRFYVIKLLDTIFLSISAQIDEQGSLETYFPSWRFQEVTTW